MGTTLTEVTDLFLSAIYDYRLNAIYTNSGSLIFNTYIEPWLLKSIQDFYICDQPLDYVVTSGSADGYFIQTLTMQNQIIISQYMELYWLQKGIQDIRAMNNVIQDHDFKNFSPAQILQARTSNYNSKREELSQKLVDYSYQKNNWNNWNSQIFP
jgi:hypothetical protein